MKSKGILAVGTIRINRLSNCEIDNNKSLQKLGRVAMDCRADNNSGIIVVKWVENSVVQLVSNYVCIEPMSEIQDGIKKIKSANQCHTLKLLNNTIRAWAV